MNYWSSLTDPVHSQIDPIRQQSCMWLLRSFVRYGGYLGIFLSELVWSVTLLESSCVLSGCVDFLHLPSECFTRLTPLMKREQPLSSSPGKTRDWLTVSLDAQKSGTSWHTGKSIFLRQSQGVFFFSPAPQFFHEYYTTLILGEFGPLDLVLSL